MVLVPVLRRVVGMYDGSPSQRADQQKRLRQHRSRRRAVLVHRIGQRDVWIEDDDLSPVLPAPPDDLSYALPIDLRCADLIERNQPEHPLRLASHDDVSAAGNTHMLRRSLQAPFDVLDPLLISAPHHGRSTRRRQAHRLSITCGEADR